MTALDFLKSICKSTSLTFAFTRHFGTVVDKYMQLVFRRPGDPFGDLILWYTIQDSGMPLNGDCSVRGHFAESDDAGKAKVCLWPLMDALNGGASWIKLTLYDKVSIGGRRTTIFSVAGKSCDEIIVKIDLCMKQPAEI